MVRIADHLGTAELQAGWRESTDATLARHYQVIWLLAEGRSCAEVARLTGFVRRWVEELAARYNRFGPSSLGDRRRRNGAKPRILTPQVLAMLRERVKAYLEDSELVIAQEFTQAAFEKSSTRSSPRKPRAIPARSSRSSPPTSTASG